MDARPVRDVLLCVGRSSFFQLTFDPNPGVLTSNAGSDVLQISTLLGKWIYGWILDCVFFVFF